MPTFSLLIKDTEGESLPGVSVELRLQAGTTLTTTSDAEGLATLKILDNQNGTLVLTLQGYQTYEHIFNSGVEALDWEETMVRTVPVAVRQDGSSIVNLHPSNPHNKQWT